MRVQVFVRGKKDLAHNHERPEVDQIDERRIRPARPVALACPIPQRVVRDLCKGEQKVYDRKADYGCCAASFISFRWARLSTSPE